MFKALQRFMARRGTAPAPAQATDPYEDALQAGWVPAGPIEPAAAPQATPAEVEVDDARDFLGRVYASQTI